MIDATYKVDNKGVESYHQTSLSTDLSKSPNELSDCLIESTPIQATESTPIQKTASTPLKTSSKYSEVSKCKQLFKVQKSSKPKPKSVSIKKQVNLDINNILDLKKAIIDAPNSALKKKAYDKLHAHRKRIKFYYHKQYIYTLIRKQAEARQQFSELLKDIY